MIKFLTLIVNTRSFLWKNKMPKLFQFFIFNKLINIFLDLPYMSYFDWPASWHGHCPWTTVYLAKIYSKYALIRVFPIDLGVPRYASSRTTQASSITHACAETWWTRRKCTSPLGADRSPVSECNIIWIQRSLSTCRWYVAWQGCTFRKNSSRARATSSKKLVARGKS